MLSKWEWLFAQLTRTLWVRAALVGIMGVVVALIAIPIQSLISEPMPFNIGSNAVDHILNILATSMLTVTIFSLSVMVSAYSAASSGVTPRATKLIKEDPTTQNTLATFLGSFLFSLVGIIALGTNLYTEVGRFILFVATLVVIVSIVVTLLRWIEHLSGLGRVGRTTAQVEEKVHAALQERIKHPSLGGRPMANAEVIPQDASLVYADVTGYIQHVDMAHLASCAERIEGEIGVLGIPGSLMHPKKALAWYRGGEKDQEFSEQVKCAFTLGEERSFDQDPRFGFAVLAEIGSRALSPAVNDAGTAIDVINRATRLLLLFGEQESEDNEAQLLHENLQVATITMRDFFDDAFMPIARDGAGIIEVQLRLQKAFTALADNYKDLFQVEATRCSGLAMQYAEAALKLDCDKARLHQLADRLKSGTSMA